MERFREIASGADEDDEEDEIEQLSELMAKSHQSLKTLYECSHENLDELVGISKAFGVGARLTGAGWGGCIVALTDSITTCDRYITTLKKSYYDKIPNSKHLDLDDVVFATVRKAYLKAKLITNSNIFSSICRNRRTEPRFSSLSFRKLFCAILDIISFYDF